MKENIQNIARRWFEEMWSIPELDIADEIVDESYKPEWIPIDEKGPAQIKYEIKAFRSVFPDLKYEIIDIISGNEKVWVRYKGKGTQKGKAWGFDPTNKEVEFEGVTILYFSQEGKVRDQWGAFCLYDILADLGLVPPFWEIKNHLKP